MCLLKSLRKSFPLNVQNVKFVRHEFASTVFGNIASDIWANFSPHVILNYWLTLMNFANE